MSDDRVTTYLSYALAAAHRAIHADLSRRLKDEGVQVEAWRIMEAIDAERTITMGHLAEKVLLAPPTLSKMVDRMVADGLVQRQIAPQDLRQVHLVLSAYGQSIRDRLRRVAQDHETALLASLGADRAAALHAMLMDLVDLASPTDRQAEPPPAGQGAARLI
jgi:DNA-binding MarR family transcriptional regulator